MLFYDPRETVLMMFVVGLITSIVQTFLVKGCTLQADWATHWLIVAQPFGFWIFAHFSANQLKLLVSTVILRFAAAHAVHAS